MNVHILAADIASRIPAMASDSTTNNASVIEHLITSALSRGHGDFRPADLFPAHGHHPAVDTIIDLVASSYHLTRADILGRSRPDHIVWPRHLAVYLSHIHACLPQSRIATLFNRDHTAIGYAIKSAIDRIATDPIARAQFHALDAKLCAHRPANSQPSTRA